MTLVVEDGSGLPDANAYCDEAYVTAFWSLRGGNATWTAANAAQKTAGVVLASEYLGDLMQFPYAGTRLGGGLEWPREGATYRRGPEIPSNVVPGPVKNAVALLAPRAVEALTAGTTLKPPAERGGAIASESLAGVGSVSYRDNAPAFTVHQDVLALLSPVLRDPVPDDIEARLVVQTEDPAMNAVFRVGTFADGSTMGSVDPSTETMRPPV